MRMRILLDQWSLSEPGSDRGLGRYATDVQRCLSLSADVELLRVHRQGDQPGGPTSISGQLRGLDPIGSAPYHAMSADHLPARKSRPWVASIQDVIPLDLRAYRRLGVRSRLHFLNARRADIVVANSSYTASRVMKRLGVDARRIEVASLPVNPRYREAGQLTPRVHSAIERAGEHFVIAMVDLRTPDYRKRYQWVTQVAHEASKSGISFVVTGRGVPEHYAPGVITLANLEDSELAALYERALAFYYPTAYEGQGLPPLEAMARGCPVIAYSNTSVREMVTESGGALLRDPAPWESQRLTGPLAVQDVRAVVNLVVDWSRGNRPDGEAVRAIASRFTEASLVDALVESYRRAAEA